MRITHASVLQFTNTWVSLCVVQWSGGYSQRCRLREGFSACLPACLPVCPQPLQYGPRPQFLEWKLPDKLLPDWDRLHLEEASQPGFPASGSLGFLSTAERVQRSCAFLMLRAASPPSLLSAELTVRSFRWSCPLTSGRAHTSREVAGLSMTNFWAHFLSCNFPQEL